LSKREKLLLRLQSSPRDLTWHELSAALNHLGFVLKQGSGARVAFDHPNNSSHIIRLHEPHGRSPQTVLVKVVNEVVKSLKEWGYL
jgi:hypothetical protein